jgi:hypothetical protein
MKTDEAGKAVLKIARDLISARGADFLRLGKGVMPDSWSWLSEFEVRDGFIKSVARYMGGEDARATFGRGLRWCEEIGFIVRDGVPGSTSIRLPKTA